MTFIRRVYFSISIIIIIIEKIKQQKVSTEYILKMNFQNPSYPKRQKYRHRSTDFTSLRYQCICNTQYFAYNSLYQHIKAMHPDYLQKNRYFTANNMIETVHPQYGYPIKKLLLQKINFKSQICISDQRGRGEYMRKLRINEKATLQKVKQQLMQKNQLARQKISEINLQNIELQRNIDLIKSKQSKMTQIISTLSEMKNSYQIILSMMQCNDPPALQSLTLDEIFQQESSDDYF